MVQYSLYFIQDFFLLRRKTKQNQVKYVTREQNLMEFFHKAIVDVEY